jgi:hypothetical protein
VNHRRFAHALGQALPLACFVDDLSELEACLSQSEALGRCSREKNWLLKRPLGFAGRGRRKVAAAPLSDADRAWVEASLRTGDGLQVEPCVDRELDCVLHGFLDERGTCTLGRPTLQDIDGFGAWQGTRIAPEHALHAHELALLEQTARQTALALHTAGYFGPFGIDAYRWRAPDGQPSFQPRSELNARFSMGWATGMARDG